MFRLTHFDPKQHESKWSGVMGNRSELANGRSFIVTRGRGAPDPSTPPDEVGVRIFYQLWQKRLHPFGDLADGDMIYWGDQKSRGALGTTGAQCAACLLPRQNQFEAFSATGLDHRDDVEYDIGRTRVGCWRGRTNSFAHSTTPSIRLQVRPLRDQGTLARGSSPHRTPRASAGR